MGTTTENYGLKKPLETDYYDIQIQNENMDHIDQALKENANSIKSESLARDTAISMLIGNINSGLAETVKSTVLTGISTVINASIVATDTLLGALGKLQAQIAANLSILTTHVSNLSNPHSVTKSQIGLGNVTNVTQMPIAGGTFTGVTVSQTNTAYGTRQLRNIIISTADPSGGASGDIWIKYTT